MANFYNIVQNPNGQSYTLEENVQVFQLDGQNIQLLLTPDLNNAIAPQVITYNPNNQNQQVVFSQSPVSLAGSAVSQPEQRASMYMIQANHDENRQVSNETYSLIFQEQKATIKNCNLPVRNQAQTTHLQSRPDIQVQKSPSLQLKQNLISTPKLNNAQQHQMKRNISTGTQSTLVSQNRSRMGGSISNMLTSSPTPSARAPIHPQNRLSLPSATNKTLPNQSEMPLSLSERLKIDNRQKLAQQQLHKQQMQRQQQPQQQQRQQQQVVRFVMVPGTNASTEYFSNKSRQRHSLSAQPQQVATNQYAKPALQQLHQPQHQVCAQQIHQPTQRNSFYVSTQQRQQPMEVEINDATMPVSQQPIRQQDIISERDQYLFVQQNNHAEQFMDVDDSDSETQTNDNLNHSQANYTQRSDSSGGTTDSESVAYLQQEIKNPQETVVQHHINGSEAKMLVIMPNSEQRLITFKIPKEDCTVQDLLDQANISFCPETNISLVTDPALKINYIVEAGPGTIISEEENVTAESSSTDKMTETCDTMASAEPKTPTKAAASAPVSSPSTKAPVHTPAPPQRKFIKGYYALCPFCGVSSLDFNNCLRCNRKLPETVKRVPTNEPAANIQSSKKDNASINPNTFYNKKTSENQTPTSNRSDVATTKTRGRGRGRGVSRVNSRISNKPVECLTISSDEEDDVKKKKAEPKEVQSKSVVNTSKEIKQSLNESLVGNKSKQTVPVPVVGGGKVGDVKEGPGNLKAFLQCRTIRIGSHKFESKDKVAILGSGIIRTKAPTLEDAANPIIFDVFVKDITEVLVNFDKQMPVLFISTTPTFASKARDLLGMQDPKGPYYDPQSEDPFHKRITLLPISVNDEAKFVIKETLSRINFKEISGKEANELLLQSSGPKLSLPTKKTTTTNSSAASTSMVIQTITVYPPPPAKGGIAINTEDYACLGEDQFLNDVIIDFYLKYLTLEKLTPEDNNRTHVFSSYFYKRLTSPHAHVNENIENLSPAAKRHARVQKWTKNVNIFEKDFVVIPINEHAHWFLAIICFPGLVCKPEKGDNMETENKKSCRKKKEKVKSLTIGNTTITPVKSASTITIDATDDGSERDEAEGDETEMETDSEDDEEETTDTSSQPKPNQVNKVPCILIFDSLAGASRARVVATLRDYLSCEHLAKVGSEKVFTKDTIKGSCPKVPQQSNFTDCGLYVLQYVQEFFQNPLVDYTLPIRSLKNWFEEIVVTRKREELANLLKTLVENTRGDKNIKLPAIEFPTQDGILKQKPEETKTKSDNENKKKINSESSENKISTSVVSTESSTKSGNLSNKSTVQQSNPQSVNKSTSADSTGTNPGLLQRVTNEAMQYLKGKRITRIVEKMKNAESQEDNQVAKKHKGE